MGDLVTGYLLPPAASTILSVLLLVNGVSGFLHRLSFLSFLLGFIYSLANGNGLLVKPSPCFLHQWCIYIFTSGGYSPSQWSYFTTISCFVIWLSFLSHPLHYKITSSIRLDPTFLVTSLCHTRGFYWKFYSLHRVSLVSPPCLVTSQSLPSGSLRRVINSSASGGRDMSQPSAAQVGLLDQVFKLNHLKSLFSLPSAFLSSGWCSRRLSFFLGLSVVGFITVIVSCFVFEVPSVGLGSLSSSSSSFGIFTIIYNYLLRYYWNL